MGNCTGLEIDEMKMMMWRGIKNEEFVRFNAELTANFRNEPLLRCTFASK